MPTPQKNKPFPVRLGEIKPLLQMQAAEQDRSLHYWILKILAAHVNKTTKKKL